METSIKTKEITTLSPAEKLAKYKWELDNNQRITNDRSTIKKRTRTVKKTYYDKYGKPKTIVSKVPVTGLSRREQSYRKGFIAAQELLEAKAKVTKKD